MWDPRRSGLASRYALPSFGGQPAPDEGNQLDALLTAMQARKPAAPQQAPVTTAPQSQPIAPPPQQRMAPPPPPPPASIERPPLDLVGNQTLSSGPDEFHRGVDLGQMSQSAVPDFQKKRNIFDRIGDQLQDPTTKGILLRNAFAMLTGGNPSAGFDWAEKRRAEAEDTRRFGLQEGLNERAANRQDADTASNIDYRAGSLGNDTYRADTDRYRAKSDNVFRGKDLRYRDIWNYRDNSTQRHASDNSLAGTKITAAETHYNTDRDYDAATRGQDSNVVIAAYGGGRGGRRNADPADERKVKTQWKGPNGERMQAEQQFPEPLPQEEAMALKNPQLRADFERKFGPRNWPD